MSIAIIVFLLTFLYIPNNATDRTTDSIIYDNRVHAFLRKLTRQNENRSNPAIQGCSFFGYDFSFLNQNNGTDYVGTDVGVITNTYKMNICGPVNDNRCQYSWRIPTSVCYICTRGNPHCLGSVTLIGSFGADGAGVAWNFIDPRKPGLGVTMTYINGQNPCFCPESQHCLPSTVVALQCAEQTEQTFRVFVNTNTCVTYLYLNIKCPN
ncbi:unnamed protein product [Rotaria sp. Silwood1]|nr:unnamed protein product [Rotaria sp. Silwood1]CAF1628104.1 unnamed protein product [Rotaria sp. Silwood1]CAF3873952.1 unnamed protein product [Rotaria sp. Silwood1]